MVGFLDPFLFVLGGVVVVVCLFVLVFRDRVSLYIPGCPGTHSVDQAGLELRSPPASASRVLGLKACATTPGLDPYFMESHWYLKDQNKLFAQNCCF